MPADRRPAITPSFSKERPMYTRNNPFAPIPQRPERHDPVRDRNRDPVFYAAFGDDEARK